MKTCTNCKRSQPTENFTAWARGRDGLASWCRQCTTDKGRDYYRRNAERLKAKKRAEYAEDPTKFREQADRWERNNPERATFLHRRSHLKRMYSLTPEQYDAMLEEQGGCCAICLKPSTDRLHVDHDHRCCPGRKSCGACVRGLLCQQCNRLLGWVDNRREAIDAYLNREKTTCQ